MSRYAAALGAALVLVPASEARLVSWPGGVTFQGAWEGEMRLANLHYTLTPKLSLGLASVWDTQHDWQFHGLQANFLVRRWNLPKAQVNLYARAAAGGIFTDHHGFRTEDAAWRGGITFDAEDRRFFFKYENTWMDGGPVDGDFSQMARIGVAPYIAEFGGVHTWLMLQADHKPEAHDPFTLTPVVRLFWSTYLVEAGVSEHGDAHLHLEIRF